MSKVDGSKPLCVKSFYSGLFNGLAPWLARWIQPSKIDGSKPLPIKFFYVGFFNGLAQWLEWWAQASEVDGSKAFSRKFFGSAFQEGIFGGCSRTNRFCLQRTAKSICLIAKRISGRNCDSCDFCKEAICLIAPRGSVKQIDFDCKGLQSIFV